jgi:hypothetical protein
MRGINRERIKSIAIIGLLLTSLIQVGILWGYQSQGTPTSFLLGFWPFGRAEQKLSDDEAREKLFAPYRLIISNGDSSHWLVSRQDPLFRQIADEALGYLKSITEGSLGRSKPSENWGDVSSKQGFILEFKAAVGPDLLKWFTGASKVAGDAPSVLKMMIKPDSVNESLSEIYILSPDGGLGMYFVNNSERPQSMQDMLTAYEEGSEKAHRNYTSMRDGNLDKYKPYEPDVLYAVKSPELWSYYRLQAAIPDRVTKPDELADILLGSEKGRFIVNDAEGLLQFFNTENIYKVYDDGYLSYKYLADTSPSDKGDVGPALLKAYAFINKFNRLTNMKADIYLSEINSTKQGYYTFKFDYIFNDMPVFINLGLKGIDGEPAVNAITVDASSKRVLQCGWVLREFSQGQKLLYNDRFTDVMDYYGVKYGDMKIADIIAGYYLDSIENRAMDPSLVVREKDKTDLTAFIMPSGKGD